MTSCSVIIVSYNTFELTKEAIASSLTAGGTSVQVDVVVVDNNSPDQSAERLRELYPPRDGSPVTIIDAQENLGFSRANNVGVKHASGEVLFFLNPDTIVHGNAIEVLCDFFSSHSDAGAVGPLVLNEDGSVQISLGQFPSVGVIVHQHIPLLQWRNPLRREDTLRTTMMEVDVVSGCALAATRRAVDEVGGWDETIFMYSEESVLCKKFRDVGLVNYFVPDAVITHLGGASTADRHAEQQVVQQRSFARYLTQHYGRRLSSVNRVSGTVGFGMRALAFGAAAIVSRGDARASLQQRYKTASLLFRWFLTSYK